MLVTTLGFIVGGSIIAVFTMVGLFGLYKYLWRKKKDVKEQNDSAWPGRGE